MFDRGCYLVAHIALLLWHTVLSLQVKLTFG